MRGTLVPERGDERKDGPRMMASMADLRSSIGLYSFVERGTIKGNLKGGQLTVRATTDETHFSEHPYAG